jgi:hypothetical protein
MKKRKSLMMVMVIAIAVACTHHQQKKELKIVPHADRQQQTSLKMQEAVDDYRLFPGLLLLMLFNKL